MSFFLETLEEAFAPFKDNKFFKLSFAVRRAGLLPDTMHNGELTFRQHASIKLITAERVHDVIATFHADVSMHDVYREYKPLVDVAEKLVEGGEFHFVLSRHHSFRPNQAVVFLRFFLTESWPCIKHPEFVEPAGAKVFKCPACNTILSTGDFHPVRAKE